MCVCGGGECQCTLPSSTSSLAIRSSLLLQPRPGLYYLCLLIIQCFGEQTQLPTDNKLSAGLRTLALGLGGTLGVSSVAQRVAAGPSSRCLSQTDFPGSIDAGPESSVLFGRLKGRCGKRKEGMTLQDKMHVQCWF